MSFLQTVAAFLLALGPLIIFHELGHYTVARLCGVKVLRFSVGIGKVVWSRRFGPDQTEWAVSVLPLGGYVKMLDSRDQDGPAMAPGDELRDFTSQNVWRRIAIVAAGPLANFLLAVLLFGALYMHGVAEPATRVGPAPGNTPAFQAGLRAGDLVTAVNGEPVDSWSELNWEIIQAVVDRTDARLEVARPTGGRADVLLPAQALAGVDVDGDVLGKLGLAMARPKPVLGKVIDGGAGARAGLRPGDLVTTVDGKPVADALALIALVRAAPGRTLAVGGVRAGEPFTLALTPDTDPATKAGVIRVEVGQAPEMVTVSAGPFEALALGARKTWDTAAMTLKMVGKMIVGEVSLKNVTGPITIADVAGQTARIGLISYLSFIAFVSVSLGVMNLLPIPVLDGGLLLYYSLEVLTGRPLPERVSEFAQRAGVGLLLMLMALAVFNDVVRLL